MDYRQRIYSAYLSARETPGCGGVPLKSITVWYEKEVLKVLPRAKEARILELGCGPGYFLFTLKKAGYRNFVGVDLGEEQQAVAERLGVGDAIVRADVFSYLEETKETYDVICAFDLLEHFRKDELLTLLDLVHARLSPGGKFIFRTPNGEALFPGRIRYGDLTHELAFTRNSLAQVLTVAGFSRHRFYPVKPVVHGLKSLGRRVIYEAFEKIFWLYLAAETGGVKDYILTQNLWGWGEKG